MKKAKKRVFRNGPQSHDVAIWGVANLTPVGVAVFAKYGFSLAFSHIPKSNKIPPGASWSEK